MALDPNSAAAKIASTLSEQQKTLEKLLASLVEVERRQRTLLDVRATGSDGPGVLKVMEQAKPPQARVGMGNVTLPTDKRAGARPSDLAGSFAPLSASPLGFEHNSLAASNPTTAAIRDSASSFLAALTGWLGGRTALTWLLEVVQQSIQSADSAPSQLLREPFSKFAHDLVGLVSVHLATKTSLWARPGHLALPSACETVISQERQHGHKHGAKWPYGVPLRRSA